MEIISYSEFKSRFKPIKNTLNQNSYLGITFDDSSDNEAEFLDEKKNDKIWSLKDDHTIVSGRKFGTTILGYIVSNIPHNCKKSDEILVSI